MPQKKPPQKGLDGSHNRAKLKERFEQLNILWDSPARLVLSCTNISVWHFPLRDIASACYLHANALFQPLHTTIFQNAADLDHSQYCDQTHGPSERQKLSELVRADHLPLICLIRSLAAMHMVTWGFNTSIDLTVKRHLTGPSLKAPVDPTYDLVCLSVIQLDLLWLARGVRA